MADQGEPTGQASQASDNRTDNRKTIRELRLARGWSQIELAYRMGKSLSTISNIEAGEQEPRIHLAELFAATLGVSLSDIRWLTTSTRRKRATTSATTTTP